MDEVNEDVFTYVYEQRKHLIVLEGVYLRFLADGGSSKRNSLKQYVKCFGGQARERRRAERFKKQIMRYACDNWPLDFAHGSNSESDNLDDGE